LELFRDSSDIFESIEQNMLDKNAFLYEEPRFILQNEVNEDLSVQYILKNYPVLKAGRWWSKNQEIDVVGVLEKSLIVGECKYSNKKVGIDILEALGVRG
jgi:AAA+ ATPase superfamily predicted ATPase